MKLDYIDLVLTIIFAIIVWHEYKAYYAPDYNKYLTFWPRFWAPTIDSLVLWIPTSLLPYLIFQIFDLERKSTFLLYCFVVFIYYFYGIYFHGTYGATIGKMITKVKVVDSITEESITFKQAFIRDSIAILLSIIFVIYVFFADNSGNDIDVNSSFYIFLIPGLWFLAEVITMLTNRRRRALHDYIAGTVVIRSNIED
ncbi:MAG: RDD family protein [Desulfobacteraceae bacterium]|nr:RDD family protein [Desulfobacteraceae bacterium]